MKLFVAFALVGSGLAGCGSSPEPTYYALAPTGQGANVGNGEGPKTVKVRQPGLIGYLDRNDIVSKVVDYRLRLKEGDRWAEPLGDMLGRVLVEDLTRRLPKSSVYSEAGVISANPDATVETDIERFDVDGSGEMALVAQVSVSQRDGHAAAADTVTLTTRPKGDDTTAIVAAMSELLGQMSDKVAGMLRSLPPLPPGPPPRPPAPLLSGGLLGGSPPPK